MSTIIFGSRGYMGQHFLNLFPEAITPNMDIATRHEVALLLDEQQPDLVINCAGKTGKPNVDWCEDHKAETLSSNVTGPLVLYEECAKRHIYWAHLSTGCIYQGDNGGFGYSETDPQNFFGSFYSFTKGLCDRILQEVPDGPLQLRLRMPFDNSSHPRSLITKLQKYPKINALPNSITYVPDFMKAAKALIEKRATGTYNVVNTGTISPHRIMEMYAEMTNSPTNFEPFIPKKNPEAKSGERSDCVLSTAKLQKEGIILQPIEEAVKMALKEYAKLNKFIVQ